MRRERGGGWGEGGSSRGGFAVGRVRTTVGPFFFLVWRRNENGTEWLVRGNCRGPSMVVVVVVVVVVSAAHCVPPSIPSGRFQQQSPPRSKLYCAIHALACTCTAAPCACQHRFRGLGETETMAPVLGAGSVSTYLEVTGPSPQRLLSRSRLCVSAQIEPALHQ